ncbi:GMC oxidoreductase [Sphaerobolus stellatus SS14]|nr:GMC oxidoreductase [Sphaerobolus stellatus SS14]
MRIFEQGIIFAFIASSYGALHEDISTLPKLNYDFVIVGGIDIIAFSIGGTAGNVIANRLTEDPRVSVLVLEAGVSNAGVFDSIVPLLNGNLAGATPYNWNFSTTPQTGLNGRILSYPRGHILGGTSSINGMFYTRGSADDYDRYAKVTGDSGWSWNSLQPYIRKNELWTLPTDGHNITGQFDPAAHGFHGINSVSLTGSPSPINDRVIQTTQQLPDEFPYNVDMNSGKPLGLSWLQSTIKKGVRSSSATSYLAPEFLNRPNLQVLLNARVTKLLKTGVSGGRLAFKGVEFTQKGDLAPILQAQASKELVLSAGVIGTPFILMHSGIGDQATLQQLGIETLLDLPSVGQNASDQPFVTAAWLVNSTDTLDTLNRNVTLFNEAFSLWNKTHGGPFGDPTASHIAWIRLPRNSSIFKTSVDPSAGPNTPHIELAIGNGAPIGLPPPTGNFLTLAISIVSVSRGSVTLASNDPFDPPVIDPGLLTAEFDLFAARAAIMKAKLFVSAPVWSDYIIEPAFGLENVTTEAELTDYIRNNAASTAHLVGTAQMSASNADYGVVNANLHVKNVNGLRIVDSSVIPFVPSAHPQAATYIFAERGADLIKSTWGIA